MEESAWATSEVEIGGHPPLWRLERTQGVARGDGQLGASDGSEGAQTPTRASVPWGPLSDVSPTS